eukprot:5803443-Karenia_brevis.AAC.1
MSCTSGWVGICGKGHTTRPIHGVVEITGCSWKTVTDLVNNYDKHTVQPHELAKYMKKSKNGEPIGLWAWELANVHRLREEWVLPRKQGQVIWANMIGYHKAQVEDTTISLRPSLKSTADFFIHRIPAEDQPCQKLRESSSSSSSQHTDT